MPRFKIIGEIEASIYDFLKGNHYAGWQTIYRRLPYPRYYTIDALHSLEDRGIVRDQCYGKMNGYIILIHGL